MPSKLGTRGGRQSQGHGSMLSWRGACFFSVGHLILEVDHQATHTSPISPIPQPATSIGIGKHPSIAQGLYHPLSPTDAGLVLLVGCCLALSGGHQEMPPHKT